MPIMNQSLSIEADAGALEIAVSDVEPAFDGVSINAAQISTSDLTRTAKPPGVIRPAKCHRVRRREPLPAVKSSQLSVSRSVKVPLACESLSTRMRVWCKLESRLLLRSTIAMHGRSPEYDDTTNVVTAGSVPACGDHPSKQSAWTRSLPCPSNPSTLTSGG
jgi:hypothetical protein